MDLKDFVKNGKDRYGRQTWVNKSTKQTYTEWAKPIEIKEEIKEIKEKKEKQEKKEEKKCCNNAKTSQSKCKKELEIEVDLSILWLVISHLRDENDELTKQVKDWKRSSNENMNTAVEWYKQIKQLKSDKSFYQKAFWIALIGWLAYWLLYNFL